MEVDTGSAVSIVSGREYNNLLKHLQLRPTCIHLKTYPAVVVKYQTQELTLFLVVTRDKKPVLLGRN